MQRARGWYALFGAATAISGLAACSSGGSPEVASAPAHTAGGGNGAPSSLALSNAANGATVEWGTSKAFNAVSLNANGTGIIIYWYGHHPSAESIARFEADHAGVAVEFRATDLDPTVLREAAQEILAAEGAAGVGGVGVKSDGSGLDVDVHSEMLAGSTDDLSKRLTQQYGVPVVVGGEAPELLG